MAVKKLSKKLPPIQEAPKSYTPYIKYTKLQFKVWKQLRFKNFDSVIYVQLLNVFIEICI